MPHDFDVVTDEPAPEPAEASKVPSDEKPEAPGGDHA
jgi:hypothetical protein